MSEDKLVIDGVLLRADCPTTLSFTDLYSWVIWQFPRPAAGGVCGAVRPPGEGYSWYPAVIETRRAKVQVFAHLEQSYATPEAAAEYLCHPGQYKTAENGEVSR